MTQEWHRVRVDWVMDQVREVVSPFELAGREVFHYSIPAVAERGGGIIEDGNTIASAKTRLTGGELLISKLNPRKGHVVLAEVPFHPTVCSGEFVVLRPRACNVRFMRYFFLSETARQALNAAVQSVTKSHQRAGVEDIAKMWVRLPDERAQQRIVHFLDRGTAHIDTLVEQKTKLKELLGGRQQALIDHVVGGSPEWPSVKLGRVVEIIPGFAFPSEGFSLEASDVRLLRGINIGVGEIDWAETVRWPLVDVARFGGFQLFAGDVVMGMDRPLIGAGMRVATVTGDDLPALLLQRVAVLRGTELLNQTYLRHVVASSQFVRHFEPILTGISVPHISPEQIADFRFPLPPMEEQHRFVARLELESRPIDRLRKSIDQQLALLAERRAALISATVTGQIDLAGHPADL